MTRSRLILMPPALASLAIALLALALPVPARAVPVPKPPAVDARAYILVDFASGRVLAENRADERMEPASLTKVMTAYAGQTLKSPPGGSSQCCARCAS
jgi:D-alanyl-D-alanine carboxypeptidase (penicillin-binding protein 5/6)